MVDRIGPLKPPAPGSVPDQTPTFKLNSPTTGKKGAVDSNHRVSWQPQPTSVAPTKTDAVLNAFLQAVKQVHPALADEPMKPIPAGGLGNDYFIIKTTRNSETGVLDCKVDYSPRGKAKTRGSS
jgi:hypothetical protein